MIEIVTKLPHNDVKLISHATFKNGACYGGFYRDNNEKFWIECVDYPGFSDPDSVPVIIRAPCKFYMHNTISKTFNNLHDAIEHLLTFHSPNNITVLEFNSSKELGKWLFE